VPREAADAYFTRRSRTAFYSGLSVPARIGGHPAWIVTIQNLDHPANVVDDVVRQFLLYGLAVILPLLLIMLGIDALILRRALRPVTRASAQVRAIDPDRLDARIDTAPLPSEVRPLAVAINDTLDRLVASLTLQRDFTADAAHELRTPVTLARMRAREIDDPVLRAALIADLDGVASIIANLLQIAELDALDPRVADWIDLSALAADCTAAIVPLVHRSGRSITFAAPLGEVAVTGDRDLIARAIGALLENAVAHTPVGTTITVTVTTDAAVEVCDDGPGIPAERQPLIFRRFWRGDRSARNSAGLGLAIVERVADLHGGRITVDSVPGRTVFRLQFPAVDRATAAPQSTALRTSPTTSPARPASTALAE
jgi:signal transduction histidine kinase